MDRLRGVCCDPRELLLYTKNRVFCRLGDSEFDDGLGWNLDLLLRFGIDANASLPLLLHELAKTGQNEFAALFNLFIGERTECIKEYSSGSFVGISGSSERDLKFTFGSCLAFVYCSATAALQENRGFSFSTLTGLKMGLKMDCSFLLP